jgi:hypothetical protein
MGDSRRWASASDLADYAYCPRSHWYHDHPPEGGPSRATRDRSEAGQRFHAHELSGERRRAEHGGAYWGALALGLLLALGALVWIFHP